MQERTRNPLGIPHGGWFPSGHQFRGMAAPTQGTVDALVEIYKGRSGGKDAETSVIWGRTEKFIHISSDRGPDIVSIVRRVGDEGILAFRPPEREGDCLLLYVKLEMSRRAWAVVRANRSAQEEEQDPADEVEEAPEDEDADEA